MVFAQVGGILDILPGGVRRRALASGASLLEPLGAAYVG